MRNFFLPAAAVVLLAVPALATAQRGDEGPDRSQPRFERVSLGVAKAHCRQEARSLGRDAFVAEHGSERPRRACVEANLLDARKRVNAATDTCKTEAADGGRQAFREKYGNRPFRRCVRAELGLGVARDGGRLEGLARKVARRECRQDARSLGRDAFVAKYGSERPRRACVEANLSDARARVNAAADTCKAEVADGGRQAFREKYGNRPFRRCVRAELQAGMSSPESG